MHPQSPALRALAEKWDAVPAAERANFQTYVTDLCEALGVARPRPRGTGYEFEYPVTTTHRRTGKESTNFIDLYRQGHFILLAVRGETPEIDGQRAIIHAYAQAKRYARDAPHNPPPYVMVMEVGRTLRLWDRWSGEYKALPAVQPQVICAQLQSLRSKGLLEAVDLEPVRFFSHYAPESLSANEQMSSVLLDIHR